MGMAVAGYFRDIVRTYRDNATSIRDYRTQMRGTRALWIWCIYLVLLVVLAMLMYQAVADQAVGSPVYMQQRLHDFYSNLCRLLAVAVCLVAPGLTAASLAAERQRKSLDLVFTAPIAPRYLLVGKILASYRYVWMLLILALPIMAVGVVFGGATWQDVLGAYVILSGSGLILTGIGVAAATEQTVPIRALGTTYVWVLGYLFLTSLSSSTVGMRGMMGSSTLEAPWTVTLSPFFAPEAAPTYSTIRGMHVPNWVIFFFVAWLITQMLISGAASALSHYRSVDTKVFRLFCLVGAGLYPYAFAAPVAMIGGFGSRSAGGSFIYGIICFILFIPIASSYPHLFASSNIEPRKRRFDGYFDIREVLTGTPSGSLPFALSLLAVYLLSFGLGALSFGASTTDGIITVSVWLVAYTFAWWAAGQLISAAMVNDMQSKRTISAFYYGVPMVTTVLLVTLTSQGSDTFSWAWYHPYFPFFSKEGFDAGLAHAMIYAAFGGVLLYMAVLKRRVPPRQL